MQNPIRKLAKIENLDFESKLISNSNFNRFLNHGVFFAIISKQLSNLYQFFHRVAHGKFPQNFPEVEIFHSVEKWKIKKSIFSHFSKFLPVFQNFGHFFNIIFKILAIFSKFLPFFSKFLPFFKIYFFKLFGKFPRIFHKITFPEK